MGSPCLFHRVHVACVCARIYATSSHLASVALRPLVCFSMECCIMKLSLSLFLTHTRAPGRPERFCVKIPSNSFRFGCDREKPWNTPLKNLKRLSRGGHEDPKQAQHSAQVRSRNRHVIGERESARQERRVGNRIWSIASWITPRAPRRGT